jgi:succinate dehydrogenase / fumarate reductase cytochrome b subunit
MSRPTQGRIRPLSPNMQIYRPQLTSVLSIVNRITGVILSVLGVGLVAWLVAAAAGPEAYAGFRDIVASWPGQIVLFGGSFAFFLHLTGGIRHLVWDSGRGFQLGTIYRSGWLVITASVVLTVATWIASHLMQG